VRTPFEDIVTRYGMTVLRVCRAVLGPGTDADDAYSETFLAALQDWPQLPDDLNVEAWLVRVAQRKAVDITRSRQRRPAPVGELPDTPGRVEHHPVADDGIWCAVAALPQRQRLAIAYHYLGGLAHTETAELIGTTPAAVRRAASDGIKSLRRSYLDNIADRTGARR